MEQAIINSIKNHYKRYGFEPTIKQVAKEVGLKREELINILEHMELRKLVRIKGHSVVLEG